MDHVNGGLVVFWSRMSPDPWILAPELSQNPMQIDQCSSIGLSPTLDSIEPEMISLGQNYNYIKEKKLEIRILTVPGDS